MAASVNQPQSQSHQIQSKNEARPISKHQEDSSIQQKASSVDAIMPKTKAKPTHQEVKPEVHKLVQSKAPKTPQAREHEVPKEFEQHVMVKDIQPPKPFWPVCSSIPLQEIQREEVIKQKEIELKKPREPQQPKPQGLISWQNKGKAYSGKSLDEIQAEEDAMRKANQKETEIRRKANELALKVNQTQPLSFADMLAADKKKKTDSKKESATLQSKQAVQKNSPTPKTKPAKVAQNGQNGSNKAKIAPKSDALMDWCIETLGSRTDVDSKTFRQFVGHTLISVFHFSSCICHVSGYS